MTASPASTHLIPVPGERDFSGWLPAVLVIYWGIVLAMIAAGVPACLRGIMPSLAHPSFFSASAFALFAILLLPVWRGRNNTRMRLLRGSVYVLLLTCGPVALATAFAIRMEPIRLDALVRMAVVLIAFFVFSDWLSQVFPRAHLPLLSLMTFGAPFLRFLLQEMARARTGSGMDLPFLALPSVFCALQNASSESSVLGESGWITASAIFVTGAAACLIVGPHDGAEQNTSAPVQPSASTH